MACGTLKVIFGEADGAVLVDGPRDLGSDVGIGDGLRAGREELRFREGVHPHLPIFAAHHRGGVGDFLLDRRLDRDGADDAFVGIDGLVGVGLADGLEHRFVDGSRLRMRAARRSE